METNAPPQATGGSFQDLTIKDVAVRLDRAVPAPYRKGYEAIVGAGMKLMFDEKTSRFIVDGGKAITGDHNDPTILAHMALNMLQAIQKASGDKMQAESAWYGLQMLSMHALDFYDRIGKIEITPDFLDTFIQQLAGGFLKANNIDSKQVADAIRRGQQEISAMTPEQRAQAEKGSA